MLCIISDSHYAPYNIATEEYLLQNKDDDCFLLYRNEPSIIVGKHQNTLSEINSDFVKAQGIPVVRRMTGGGTVFHDMGNLNFCFIMNNAEDTSWTFEKYTRPVLQVLHDLGIDAKLEGRNDLTIGGKKFSGNAKMTYRNKVLQHGTILFSSKMTDLSAALKVNPLKFTDKAVKSVQSRVTNVSEHLSTPLDLDDFIALVHNYVRSLYPEAMDYSFSAAEQAAISALVDTKYGTWDWNYGASPKYNFSKAIRTKAGTIEFYLNVSKGKIDTLQIYGDFFGRKDIDEFAAALIGVLHNPPELLQILQNLDVASYFGDVSPSEILEGLF
ncbi:MAG: lipoate--protein ligase [Candidatus Cloacimonetes bacterium HGW-Cloacimonetes-1]|jgi:lipoate-protein ligase A|nr:MAG: lipoate--protein ligase [Candidatus Cloacimonetes bacterium HGW-Cloacimonetes-1]